MRALALFCIIPLVNAETCLTWRPSFVAFHFSCPPTPRFRLIISPLAMSAAAPSRTSSTLLPYLSIFKTKVNLILASKSPRRQEILQLMGFDSKDFAVLPSDFPEDLDKRSKRRGGEL